MTHHHVTSCSLCLYDAGILCQTNTAADNILLDALPLITDTISCTRHDISGSVQQILNYFSEIRVYDDSLKGIPNALKLCAFCSKKFGRHSRYPFAKFIHFLAGILKVHGSDICAFALKQLAKTHAIRGNRNLNQAANAGTYSNPYSFPFPMYWE